MIAILHGGPADGLTLDTAKVPYPSGLPGSTVWIAAGLDGMIHQYQCREAGRYEHTAVKSAHPPRDAFTIITDGCRVDAFRPTPPTEPYAADVPG